MVGSHITPGTASRHRETKHGLLFGIHSSWHHFFSASTCEGIQDEVYDEEHHDPGIPVAVFELETGLRGILLHLIHQAGLVLVWDQ